MTDPPFQLDGEIAEKKKRACVKNFILINYFNSNTKSNVDFTSVWLTESCVL